MIELFQAGETVPRSWFTKYENVLRAVFVHPCVVVTTPEQRKISKASPALAGPLVEFTPKPNTDGKMFVDFDRPTVIAMSYQDAPR